MDKKIVIGCDHAGFDYKEMIKKYVLNNGFQVEDKGCFSKDSVDYPDFAHQVGQTLNNDVNKRGILVCGSGNGVNIVANKYNNVRSALCWNEEIALLARQHNNANCIAIPARFISEDEAKKIVAAFLNTAFEGGRHQTRVDKIAC